MVMKAVAAMKAACMTLLIMVLQTVIQHGMNLVLIVQPLNLYTIGIVLVVIVLEIVSQIHAGMEFVQVMKIIIHVLMIVCLLENVLKGKY
jgi:hypothetical protein